MDDKKPTETTPKLTSHKYFLTFEVLAIVLPIVGIVIGIAYLTKKGPLDKAVGKVVLITAIIAVVLWGGINNSLR